MERPLPRARAVVHRVSPSALDVIGEELGVQPWHLGVLDFGDELLVVHDVERTTHVDGYDNCAFGWSFLVES